MKDVSSQKSNKAVPPQIRESLNIESGLNDGLCVPILQVFIALAEGSTEGGGILLALSLVLQELGIGLGVGLAIACFSTSQSLHGSGYIAAFSGGLLFGYTAREETVKLVLAAEGTGETLALMTWLLFGSAVMGEFVDAFTWKMVLYALLSLTVIRMLPIFLSLKGTGESTSSKLFMGWFEPSGLASIVFAIIVLNEELPGSHFMAMVVVCTVFFSLVAHGISVNPLARLLGKKEGGDDRLP